MEPMTIAYIASIAAQILSDSDYSMEPATKAMGQYAGTSNYRNMVQQMFAGGGSAGAGAGARSSMGKSGTSAGKPLENNLGPISKDLAGPKSGQGIGTENTDIYRLMMMNLLNGGNSSNPSASPLDISDVSLVGLTPEHISQALQLKFMSEELEQKRISDSAKMIQPAEVKDERTTKIKNYEYYLEQEKAAKRIPKSMEEWDVGLVKERRLYNEAIASGMSKEKNPFHEWLFDLKRASATDITISEQVTQKLRSKDIAYVTGPKISQDITNMLNKDPERLREQPYIKKYMEQGMSCEEAEIRARKAAHRMELLRQFQAVYDKLGMTSTFGKEGIEVDGVLKQRY